VGVGSGLGLSVCRNIVSGLSGSIQLKSHVGRGTRVRVVLPATTRASEPLAAPVAPATVVRPPLRRARVLVVDDEPAVGAVLVRVLRDHDVVAVTSVAEAVAAIEATPHFDLVLSDVMMPEQSGVDFFAILQERFAALADRVVFMSGGAFTTSAQGFLDGRRRLDKPFDARQVRELVASAIADHQP
jgi:CheY-like chemotaxis protein